MRFTQSSTYKFCDNYIKQFLHYDAIKARTKIWDAFKEVCGSEAKAKEALTKGGGPLVWIKKMTNCGLYQGRSGGEKHIVYVDECIANGYEKGTAWQTWEATVLHELVHWARFHAGKTSQFAGQEAGNAFEIKAFGSVQPCSVTCGTH